MTVEVEEKGHRVRIKDSGSGKVAEVDVRHVVMVLFSEDGECAVLSQECRLEQTARAIEVIAKVQLDVLGCAEVPE